VGEPSEYQNISVVCGTPIVPSSTASATANRLQSTHDIFRPTRRASGVGYGACRLRLTPAIVLPTPQCFTFQPAEDCAYD